MRREFPHLGPHLRRDDGGRRLATTISLGNTARAIAIEEAMDRRIVLGAIAIGALALGGAWWLTQARDAPMPSIVRDSGGIAADADDRVAAQAGTKPATADLLPAPPPPASEIASTPAAAATNGVAAGAPLLRDEIADLDRRARAGDANAACRLGAELLLCERARVMQPYTDNIEGQARAIAQRGVAQQEVDRQIDAALRRQADNAAALARCEGVDESRWPVPARYFHLAAQAGHRPSMAQFLNAERFRAEQLFRDPELIPLFRANAPRYFQQLLEEGDAELLQRWSMSAAMPHDILHEVLPPPWNDPGFAAAMQQQALMGRGIQPPPLSLRHPPTAEQVAEAERVYSRYFAPRRVADEELRRHQAASPYDLEAFRCDEAASTP